MRVVTLATCKHCAGLGYVYERDLAEDPLAETITCQHCGGSGDLDGARLLEAYRLGQKDTLNAFRWAFEQAGLAITHKGATMSGDELRRRVGR